MDGVGSAGRGTTLRREVFSTAHRAGRSGYVSSGAVIGHYGTTAIRLTAIRFCGGGHYGPVSRRAGRSRPQILAMLAVRAGSRCGTVGTGFLFIVTRCRRATATGGHSMSHSRAAVRSGTVVTAVLISGRVITDCNW